MKKLLEHVAVTPWRKRFWQAKANSSVTSTHRLKLKNNSFLSAIITERACASQISCNKRPKDIIWLTTCFQKIVFVDGVEKPLVKCKWLSWNSWLWNHVNTSFALVFLISNIICFPSSGTHFPKIKGTKMPAYSVNFSPNTLLEEICIYIKQLLSKIV